MVKPYFKEIKNILIKHITASESEILIAVAWFTNHELFDCLCDKLEKGIMIKLCLINDEINNREYGLNFQRFIDLGGGLYFNNNEELMHHKFCIIDKNILFNGSYNWTYYAENRNRENIIFFKDFPELVSEFETEFALTIQLSDLITNMNSYVTNHKPQYSHELLKYLSYDTLYQAKQNTEINNIKQADILIRKSLIHYSQNNEAIIEKTKIDAIKKTEPNSVTNTAESPKPELDVKAIIHKLHDLLCDNYLCENPDRQKALRCAHAIYDYEIQNNFQYISEYLPYNVGYILMVFGEYNKAKDFFTRSDNALGKYDFGVLSLMQNDFDMFKTLINSSLEILLRTADQTCAAIYIPRKHDGMIEYIEKKKIDDDPISVISLKETILQVKNDFQI